MTYKNKFKILMFIALFVFCVVAAKKTRRSKKPKVNSDETTPQPELVTYSSFGLDDVREYDGFMPSSPDHASYFNTANQEEFTTNLYGPAFPTALDESGTETISNNNDYENHNAYENDFEPIVNNVIFKFQNNGFSDAGAQTSPDVGDTHVRSHSILGIPYSYSTIPEYGTRLPPKSNVNPSYVNSPSYNLFGQYNLTQTFNTQSNYNKTDAKTQHSFDGNENYQNNEDNNSKWLSNYYNQITTTSPLTDYNISSFSKVIDLTDKQYPNPFQFHTKNRFGNVKNHNPHLHSENIAENMYSNYDNLGALPSRYKSYYNFSNISPGFNTNNYEHKPLKEETYTIPKRYAHIGSQSVHENPVYEYSSINYNPDPTSLKSSFKTLYQKRTNTSRYQKPTLKKPLQIVKDDSYGSSTNTFNNFLHYDYPSTRYSFFENENQNEMSNYKKPQSVVNYSLTNPWKTEENTVQEYKFAFHNPTKATLQNTAQTMTTHWGNIFKTSNRGSPFKTNSEKLQEYNDESENVVYIPKRPRRYKNTSTYTSQSMDNNKNWKVYKKQRPSKVRKAKPIDEWNKDISGRFKSEEDLMGLRNHDTSYPSYLPSFSLNSYAENYQDYEASYNYREAIEKWRQSYLNSRHPKDFDFREPEKSSSDSHPVHVPIPKPYPVEIPHPVIVPVLQPYPVRVPVPKPVAVPVVQQVNVPIEKPVPYPVVKKVPYPIEKLVPVPVEKEVAVQVIKPYPVPIPHVQPVHHHEDDYSYDDHDYEHEDYEPPKTHSRYRGGKKTVVKIKKPKSSRYRPHRSSQLHLQERKPTRWASHSLLAPLHSNRRRPPQQMKSSLHLNGKQYYNN